MGGLSLKPNATVAPPNPQHRPPPQQTWFEPVAGPGPTAVGASGGGIWTGGGADVSVPLAHQSPGNTTTTTYGHIYNPAAPPPTTYMGFGGGGGGNPLNLSGAGGNGSAHSGGSNPHLRLAGSGSGSDSDAAARAGMAAGGSVVAESTSDGGFIAAMQARQEMESAQLGECPCTLSESNFVNYLCFQA